MEELETHGDSDTFYFVSPFIVSMASMIDMKIKVYVLMWRKGLGYSNKGKQGRRVRRPL
jgi:hypothetical protein